MPGKKDPPLRGRIFPIPFTNSKDKTRKLEFRVLSETASPTRQPVALRQITVMEGQTSWTEKKARTHLVNEAPLALRKVVRNTNNLHNPMKEWDDASWIFRWVEDDREGSHYICMPFIPIVRAPLPLLQPERHKWITILPGIRDAVWGHESFAPGQLVSIGSIDIGLLKEFLGDHLIDPEPSPLRPLHKRAKQALISSPGADHPLGLNTQETTEDELGFTPLTKEGPIVPE